MSTDHFTYLLAQTTLTTEQHTYVEIGGRQVKINPPVLLAGFVGVVLACVAAIVGFRIYRNRIKKRAKE